MIVICHVIVRKVVPDFGGYTIIVCEDIDTPGKYYMVTRLPNWNCPVLEKNDAGFLKYQAVIAGETEWWDQESGTRKAYRYNADYLLNFVLDSEEDALIL